MKTNSSELLVSYRPVGSLKDNPNNSRIHSKHQVRQIANSIKAFGFTNPVLLDKTNTVVAGHGRVAAARFLGMSEVPTIRLESLTPEQVRAYVIADNRLAEKAGWETEINPEGLPEGGSVRVLVNRYERSYINRMDCLAVFGYSCMACGFDFEQIYGDIGEGFIHVHHITPVSQMDAGYVVDPTQDLIPLCPNCHAMAHTSNPPLSVDQLKRILYRNTLQN